MNPEQKVIDEIDALVNEQLTHVPDDYSKNNERYVKCLVCHQQWHGLPNFLDCPGENATPTEVEVWRQAHSKSVESQQHSDHLHGPVFFTVGDREDNRQACVFYDAAGRRVDGTLTFIEPAQGCDITAVFTPDDGLPEPRYTYDVERSTLTFHTESDDSVESGSYARQNTTWGGETEVSDTWAEIIAREALSHGTIQCPPTLDTP